MFWKKKAAELPIIEEIKVSEKFKDVKGRTLKEALFIAINALEKDIFAYDWLKQSNCNCGIMVQCILGADKHSVGSLFHEARMCVTNDQGVKDKNRTWREVAQRSCSVTGKPLTEVFMILSNHGFFPEDIVHLEFMNNPAIMEISGINKDEKLYWTNKDNLIKYLKGWLNILNEKTTNETMSERGVLEAKLLIATSSENFEDAAKIRDEISNL